MTKIIYFEKPEQHTIREIIDASKAHKHYIVKAIYGDFENMIEFAIVDLQVALKYTHYCPTSIYGAKWAVVLQETNKNILNFKKCKDGELIIDTDKQWQDIPANTDCYSDSYYLDHIEDIYKEKIEVIGYVEE